MVKFSSGEASEEFTSPKRVKLSECEGSSEVPNMGNNLHCSGEAAAVAAAAAAVGSGKALIATIDPDTFECSICMEPLSPPIFQCSNGHIACSSCCVMMDSRCPSCLKPTGKIRCLAIEKLIESMKVGCKYAHNGCRELVRYSQMTAHESKCMYAPFLCPVSGCSFSGQSTEFSDHFKSLHGARVIQFSYEAWFTVSLATEEQFCILKAFLEEHYSYQIEIKKGRRRLTMESVPRSIVGIHENRQDFLLTPVETYEEDGHLKFELSFRHVI